jgi:hypothetical protein
LTVFDLDLVLVLVLIFILILDLALDFDLIFDFLLLCPTLLFEFVVALDLNFLIAGATADIEIEIVFGFVMS